MTQLQSLQNYLIKIPYVNCKHIVRQIQLTYNKNNIKAVLNFKKIYTYLQTVLIQWLDDCQKEGLVTQTYKFILTLIHIFTYCIINIKVAMFQFCY